MRAKTIAIMLLAWLTGVALVSQGAAKGTDVAAVVNPRNPAVNVRLAELRRIFAGEKRTWSSGRRIKLIVRAPGCHERLVLLKLLGMSESEYVQYWAALVFRGEADAEPLVLPSMGMQREAISAFPDAITLVEAKDVKPGMKVIRVEGHMPEEPGYPLR
jgi:ABC-type phosphate transport system substrate-binding protein